MQIQSNLGCQTQFVLEGCSKTDLFENRINRNNKLEINSFYTPKEYSETSVLEGLGVGTIRFSNKLWGRWTCTKKKPRFQCLRDVYAKRTIDSLCRRNFRAQDLVIACVSFMSCEPSLHCLIPRVDMMVSK